MSSFWNCFHFQSFSIFNRVLLLSFLEFVANCVKLFLTEVHSSPWIFIKICYPDTHWEHQFERWKWSFGILIFFTLYENENANFTKHVLFQTVDFRHLQQMSERGVDFNKLDSFGQSVLHEVARIWHTDVAKFLIDQGNSRSSIKRHYALALIKRGV